MIIFKNILYYLKYFSFICFLIAAVIVYPSLMSFNMGICCLVLTVLYSIVTIVMFLSKNKGEQYNIFNNFVLCFLHFYFCFIAYKYYSVGDVFNDQNNLYFSLNYFVASLCLFILTINKFILTEKN